VLVVEDDDGMREPVEDALCTFGFEHDWARSQQEARELLDKHDYGLALVDLATELLGKGVLEFITKPFPTTGRTLPRVIEAAPAREIELRMAAPVAG
jgi:CheY-like chemotaxis protein